MEKSVEKFLRNTFSTNPDFGKLTKSNLRQQFLVKMKISELSKTEMKLFSSLVNKILLEYTENNQVIKSTKTKAASHSENECDADEDSDPEALVIMEEPAINDDSYENDKDKSKKYSPTEIETPEDVETSEDFISPSSTRSQRNKKNVITDSSSDSEDENNLEEQKKKITFSSESENEDVKCNRNNTKSKSDNGFLCSSDEELDPSTRSPNVASPEAEESDVDDMPLKIDLSSVQNGSKMKKRKIESDDSMSSSDEDTEKEVITPNRKKMKAVLSSESEDEEKSSTSSLKENSDSRKKKKTPSRSQKTPNEKNNSPTNAKIEKLKKYLRTAGIRLPSYNKVWHGCNSLKAKANKLLEILEDAGMKGTPTIEKCKKLRKKIERKKEVAELDVSNIIHSEGRPKRNVNSFI